MDTPENKSIISYLKRWRVCIFDLSQDKKILEIKENCDVFFSVLLNKQDLALFIEELSNIYASMKDMNEQELAQFPIRKRIAECG